MGERLTVQFARGSRQREGAFGNHERTAPRPRRTAHRMTISGLPNDTSWQVCLPSPFLVAGLPGFSPLLYLARSSGLFALDLSDCAGLRFWEQQPRTVPARSPGLVPRVAT